MQHSFKSSLNKGQVGEEFLLKHWPELKRLSGRDADFELPDGRTLELKTDYYCMDKTQNLFIEKISNASKQSPGGPWQAASKQITLFAYLYIKNGVLWLFDTDKLVTFLESTYYPESEIRNKNYITIGMKVPRADVAHIATIKEFSNGNK